jgi:methylglutaconyl-CoA hydratase
VCRAAAGDRQDAAVTSDRVVQVDVVRGVATLTLDSPDNRNALSRAMRAQLRAALADALADDAVRVVVLDHTGRVFCSGMDLGEAAGGGVQDQGVREFPELLELIWSSPKPVVAVVRGPARAGGVGLLAACDVVVAGASATFAFSEVRLGIVPAVISAVVLPRMVPHVAHRLMLTGKVFDAAAAAAGGLVDLVVPDADVDAEVRAQLVELTAGAPAALAETKRLLRERTAALDFEELLELSARFFASEEGQEGIASFREKRPARWVPTDD